RHSRAGARRRESPATSGRRRRRQAAPAAIFPWLETLTRRFDSEEGMLRLHGFPFSNYHNVVKVVLLEKCLAFEEIITYPPADEVYRAKNPTGKYPCLETEDGIFLGESKVILNYLEDRYPGVRLLPANALERARVRELMEVIDLYLELPA